MPELIRKLDRSAEIKLNKSWTKIKRGDKDRTIDREAKSRKITDPELRKNGRKNHEKKTKNRFSKFQNIRIRYRTSNQVSNDILPSTAIRGSGSNRINSSRQLIDAHLDGFRTLVGSLHEIVRPLTTVVSAPIAAELCVLTCNIIKFRFVQNDVFPM